MLNSLIVYIEDSPDDVVFLQHALEQTKHQGGFMHLDSAANTREYLEAAAKKGECPGLILVDMHVGVDSGKQLIQLIRSYDIFHKVPIVSLSGSYTYEDLDSAYKTGANLFMLKPHELHGWTELVFKVRDYFSPAT